MTHPVDTSSPTEQNISVSRRRPFLPELIPLAIITAFVIIQMWPFTFGGMALMPDTWQSVHPWARGVDVYENDTSIFDTVLEYGPWYEYSRQCLMEGRVPHWNTMQFCGAPLYANRLIPFFYPPFIVAELIGGPHTIIGWFQLFNLILSGWGMFFLLRRWRIPRAVSTCGALLWLTCGVHILPFPLWTLGAVGFPWLLWALEGFLEKPGVRQVIIASFIMGLILLVGYPILIVQLSYFTIIYFIARWWVTRRIGPNRIHWTIPLGALLAFYFLGFGISAIANVPAWSYSQQTVRQVEGFIDKAYEREKRMLITPVEEAGMDPVLVYFGERMDTILPINGRGTYRAWMFGGVLVYLLAFLGILAGRMRAFQIGIIGFLFSILVWIPESYIALLDILPGWRITILQPIAVVNLSAYLLAAFGLEALLVKNRRPDIFEKILFAILAIASILLMVRILRNAPVINLPMLHVVQNPNLLGYSTFHRYWFIAGSIIAIAVALLVFLSTRLSWLRWTVIVAILGFSLVTFNYLQPFYSRNDYFPPTPFTDKLAELTADIEPSEGNRMARWAVLPLPFNPHKRTKSPFTPNVHMLYGIHDVGGYDSLVPKRFIDYNTLFEDAFMDYRALIAYRNPATINHSRFLDMGVRWVVTLGELPEDFRDGYTLVWDDRYDGNHEGTDESDDFIQMWEVDDPRPRAFLTRRVAWLSDPADNPLVQAANWAARRINAVVVENPGGDNRTFAFPEELDRDNALVLDGSTVEVTRDDPEHMILEVFAPEESWLVLRDGWNPEWKAYVDGVETPIYPADSAFRAVYVPQGNHSIEIRYIPSAFYKGMWVSIGTLLFMILLYLVSGGRTRKISPSASKR